MDEYGEKERLEYTTIWEEEDVAHKLIAKKAASILQCATYTEAVYFEFRKHDFKHYTEAFALISKEIGPLKGVRRVTRFSYQSTNTLMIEVQFVAPEDRIKAIKKGLIFQAIQYKGTPANDGITDKLVRVTLCQLPYFLSDDVLVKQLLEGLRRYGKVCQIKKISNRGYFEGDAIVLMDINAVNGIKWQPLERKLYLEPWDMEVTASFRGAPPICYGCRESGHIRKDCPKMKNTTCYNCYGKGHFARHCKNPARTEKEALDEYVRMAALRDAEKEQLEANENQDSTTSVDNKDVADRMDLGTQGQEAPPSKEHGTDGIHDTDQSDREDTQEKVITPANLSHFGRKRGLAAHTVVDDPSLLFDSDDMDDVIEMVPEPKSQEKAADRQAVHQTGQRPATTTKSILDRRQMLKESSTRPATEYQRKRIMKPKQQTSESGHNDFNLENHQILPGGHHQTTTSGRKAHD
jgi:hypothetical protein